MNYNDEETPKLNLGREKKFVNANSLQIVILGGVFVALVIALIFFIAYKPEDNFSSKIEISLNVTDVKISDSLKCDASEDAIKDSKNIKLTYKKSDEKFYFGEQKNMIDEDGTLIEPDEKDLRNGVDLVIDNITDKVYVVVEYSSDEDDSDAIKYYYKDTKDGKISIPFASYKTTSVSVFVYNNDENCNKLLKNYSVVLPRYNDLHNNEKCNTTEGKESKYCVEYTYDNFNESVLNKLETAKKDEAKLDVVSIVIVFVLFAAAGVFIFIKLR